MTTAAIKFEDYQKLISQQAWKGHARLQAMGVSMDYDDVFQQMCETFLIASNSFDPERGFKFSTYLVTSIYRQFNRWVEPMIEGRKLISSVEELEESMGEGTGEESSGSLLELIASDEPTPEDAMLIKRNSMAALDGLSSDAKKIVHGLIEPVARAQARIDAREAAKRDFGLNGHEAPVEEPSALEESFAAWQAHLQHGRDLGVSSNTVPTDINFKFLCQHYGLSRYRKQSVRDELIAKFGVKI